MAQPPPDVEGDDCLPEYRHLFCPDLLRDQVAFITGGGSGIGFRIAEVFMRHGCHTVIASRSLPRVLTAAKKLAAATGRRCLPLSVDVRDAPGVMAAVDQALQEFGKVDILVNCAAGNFLCPAGALSFNAFKTVIDIDTIGTFNVSRVLYEKVFQVGVLQAGVLVGPLLAVSRRVSSWRGPRWPSPGGCPGGASAGRLQAGVLLAGPPLAVSRRVSSWRGPRWPSPGGGVLLAGPPLAADSPPHPRALQNRGGVIVNITATLGLRGQVLQVHAGSAKAAVDAMTRHLAVEWGPRHVRVNSLAPGPISGTEGLRRLGGPQAGRSTSVPAIPLQRLGNKTEVAHSALYLASSLSSYVTGAMLVVDGGAWLTLPNQARGQVDSAPLAKL
nr:peroxisomal 2,4-dienoyl-CoA reductase [(3E)-enoyl-CoA-producing] isoform X3 [Oryctolagus cuniculus]